MLWPCVWMLHVDEIIFQAQRMAFAQIIQLWPKTCLFYGDPRVLCGIVHCGFILFLLLVYFHCLWQFCHRAGCQLIPRRYQTHSCHPSHFSVCFIYQPVMSLPSSPRSTWQSLWICTVGVWLALLKLNPFLSLSHSLPSFLPSPMLAMLPPQSRQRFVTVSHLFVFEHVCFMFLCHDISVH